MKPQSLLTSKEFEAETKSIFKFLNFTLGMGLFMQTMTALQFPSPWKINLLALPLWIFFLFQVSKMPYSLIALRALASETSNKEAIENKKIIERQYSRGMLFKAPIMWIGLVFYIIVLINPLFPHAQPIKNFIHWIKY